MIRCPYTYIYFLYTHKLNWYWQSKLNAKQSLLSSNPVKYHQKMMQSENFPLSCSFDNFVNSTIDQFDPYGLNMGVHVDGCEFSSSFTTREDSSEISSISHFSTMFSSEIFPYPACDNELQVTEPLADFSVPLEGLESMLTGGIEDLYNCLDESEESFPSQPLRLCMES